MLASLFAAHPAVASKVFLFTDSVVQGAFINLLILFAFWFYQNTRKPKSKSIFPKAEDVDLEQAATLTTTITASIAIPKGAISDGSSLLIDGEQYHVGIWLYNDSETRCLVPFHYGDTENSITEGWLVN